MKLRCLILPMLVGLAGCGPAPPPAAQIQYLEEPPAQFPEVAGVAGPHDIGLFLAGQPVVRGAVLSRLQQTVEYQTHRREMSARWRFARLRMDLMGAWSDRELLPRVGGGGTVFYPFGGPDLLYANAMFPHARTYVLMGLEPVGEVAPLETMAPGEVFAALADFRTGMHAELQTGYFITEEMRGGLERSHLRGVTPILLGTVALAGGQVDAVSGISAGGKPGVEVRFRDAAGVPHRAVYVAGDLSNSGFGGGYRQWLASFGSGVSYFKAASYLMHDESFSRSREFFLTQSRAILQDDSGIPYRHFGQGWSLRFYGNYERPIALFAKHHQEDLHQAFATNPGGPLDFGTGYHVNRWEGNLLLAIKR